MNKKTSIITVIQCPNCEKINCDIWYAHCEDDDNYCNCPDCGYESDEGEFTWLFFEVENED